MRFCGRTWELVEEEGRREGGQVDSDGDEVPRSSRRNGGWIRYLSPRYVCRGIGG